MKKFFKFKYFLILIAGGVLIYYFFFANKNSEVQTTILNSQVKVSSIENSIKVTGTAELIDEQTMRFNQVGKVAQVYFKDGDSVKAGDIIATLDQEDALNNVNQSRISLQSSNIKLQELLKGNENKDILKAENDVLSTQNSLKIAQDSLNNLIKEKDSKLTDVKQQISSKTDDINNKNIQLQTLQSEYEVLLKQEDKSLSNFSVDTSKTLDTAYADAKQYLVDAANYLEDIDVVFGITEVNKNKNDSFEQYLSVRNTSLKTTTESLRSSTQNLLNKSRDKVSSLNISSLDSSSLKSALQSIQSLYQSLSDLGNTAGESVGASVNASSYSQTQIDSDKNTMTQIGSSAKSTFDKIKTTLVNIEKLEDPNLIQQQSQTSISNKLNSIKTLETTIKTLNLDLNTLSNNLELTSKDYDIKIQQKQYDIQNLENTFAVNQENLRLIKEGSTQEQIALAKNDIAKAQLSLENSQKTLEKYQLEAPFDGIIRKIDFKVGDNIIADEQKYVYIENPNLIQITALLDQIDIVKVQVGQSVRIVFDSYTDKEFTGQLVEINSTPVTSSGVTSYQVKITLDKGENKIYSGMTAKVYIIVDKKDNILTIPSSFVQKIRDKSFVMIMSGNQEVLQEVVLGITNSTSIEVLSGLDDGDKIFKKVNVTKSTSSTSSQRTLMPTPGSGGGRMRQGG